MRYQPVNFDTFIFFQTKKMNKYDEMERKAEIYEAIKKKFDLPFDVQIKYLKKKGDK